MIGNLECHTTRTVNLRGKIAGWWRIMRYDQLTCSVPPCFGATFLWCCRYLSKSIRSVVLFIRMSTILVR